jgi:O-antigen ligase
MLFPFPSCASLFDMHVLVPLIAALLPLVIAPGLVSYFDITPKIAILLFGTTLILLYPATNVRNVRALMTGPLGRWFVILLAAQWLAVAAVTVFSSYPGLSFGGSAWRRYGLISQTGLLLFALLAVAWLASDARNIRILLRACCAAGAIAALYGIAQYFGLDPFLRPQDYHVGEGAFTIVRPPGTLGHAGYFATWLVAVTFFALALARLEPPGWRRASAVATSTAAAVAIVLSGTRSAILGLLAGVIALVALERPRFNARALAIGAACVVAAVLFFVSPAGAKLRARVQWSREDPLGGARLLLWRDSFQMALHQPLAGFGPETFATEFPRFESRALARAYPDFYHESPHNIFLDALTTEGFGGLLALLAICGLAAWTAIRAAQSPQRVAHPLAGGFAGSLIAQQFVVFIVPTAVFFYLTIGALVVVVSTLKAPPKSPRPAFSWLVLLIGVALGILFAGYAARLLGAGRVFSVTQQRIASGDVTGAAESYRAVLKWQPPGGGDDLDYSRGMQQLSTRTSVFATQLIARQQALEAGARAVLTAEDRQNAWYHLATLFAAESDAGKVERSLRNAIAWAPNWFKPHWTLAQLLEMTNRHAEALAEARTAVDLNGGHDPEVSATLRQIEQHGTVPR